MIKVFSDKNLRNVNAFLVYNEDKQAILIDTGNMAYQDILKFVDENKIKITNVFITHGHFSHFYGINEIVNNQNPQNVYVHQEDLLMLFDPNKNTSAFFNFQKEGWIPEPFRQLKVLRQNSKLNINGLDIEVISLPGHTPGSILIVIPQLKMIFNGDTVFLNKSPLTVAADKYDVDLYKKNVEYIINNFDHDFELYPGHFEYGFKIKDLLCENEAIYKEFKLGNMKSKD